MRARALIALAVVSACDVSSTSLPADAGGCAADRRTASGACCPAWSAPDEAGACALRPWVLPRQGDGVGHLGAHAIAVTMDGRGAGVLAWLVSVANGVRLERAEEFAPGEL